MIRELRKADINKVMQIINDEMIEFFGFEKKVNEHR